MRAFETIQRRGGSRFGLRSWMVTADGIERRFAAAAGIESAALRVAARCQEASVLSID
jgi:hypothetical protein